MEVAHLAPQLLTWKAPSGRWSEGRVCVSVLPMERPALSPTQARGMLWLPHGPVPPQRANAESLCGQGAGRGHGLQRTGRSSGALTRLFLSPFQDVYWKIASADHPRPVSTVSRLSASGRPPPQATSGTGPPRGVKAWVRLLPWDSLKPHWTSREGREHAFTFTCVCVPAL